MSKHLSPIYKVLLLAVLGNAGFAVSDAAVKYLTPHYSTYQIISCDLLITSVLFLLFSSKLGGLRSLRDPQNAKFHALRGLLNLLGSLVIVYLFSIFPLTSVYTVIFLMPFIMTLIAIPVYKERVKLHRWVTMVIGFSGILIAFQPWNNDMPLHLWLPLLAAPFCFGALHLTMRSIKGSSDLAVGFYPTCLSGLFAMPLVLMNGGYVPFTPLHFAVLCCSALGIAVGFFCLSRAFHKADASLVSPMQYTQILWGVLFGIFVFGDLPNPWVLSGAAVVILSGIHLIRHERSNTPPLI